MTPIQYFGEAWNDEIRKLEARPAPLGDLCLWCGTPILLGERGLFIPCLTAWGAPSSRPEHVECFMRQIIGSIEHQEKRCSCEGGAVVPGALPEPSLTRREEAVAAHRHWLAGQRNKEAENVQHILSLVKTRRQGAPPPR